MVAPSRPTSALAVATLFLAFAQLAVASVFTCTGGTVYVVAHADDDLLFQSPDLLTDMTNNLCVTTIFLSAGDSGTTGDSYVRSRESGNEAATAHMAGVADSYTEISAIFGGQPVVVRTLVGAPSVQKVWFRIPDGNMDGSGFSNTGYGSLRQLYFGSISSITNQPRTATYTLATLKQAIGEILNARIPDNVRTLDYLSDYDGGDHSDHITTGRLVRDLVGTYAPNAGLAGYMGYPVVNMAPTMSTGSAAFQGKADAFFTYTPYDSAECQSFERCTNDGRGESYWLVRQYVVTPEIATSSYIGSSQTPVVLPNATNIARFGSCAGSTEGGGQPARAAIDGVVSGWPGNASAEWSTTNEGEGATFKITWPTPYTITDVALYDRPNQNDWMTAGTLTFADGSVSNFGALANDGSATLITLNTPVVTDSVLMTVTEVSGDTASIGLAEFQAFGTPCIGCAFNSTSTITTTTTSSGFIVGNGAYSDLALQATAHASSEVPGQEATKVNNGIIGGYTDDNSAGWVNEWASKGELVGAWINLTFPAYYMVDSLIFYDRPNDGDWVTGGHVDFDDGTSVSVPTLRDDGSATIVNLTRAVNISSFVFTVSSVGPYSNSIGLSEISASYSRPQTPVNFTAPLYIETNTTVTSNSTSAIPLVDTANDLALKATATASSFAVGQEPYRAIDGWVDGYKEQGNGIPGEEWASRNEKAGAWILLTWPEPIAITRVTLYDRPNYSDRILKGTFTWSDGTKRDFGALATDGSATTFTLSEQVNTTSLLITVTGVSSTTNSVGLSEVSVFGPGALVRNIAEPVQLGNSSVAANLTASANITANATITSSSLLPSATGLNATSTLNSTSLNATSTLNSTLPSATSLNATSTISANSTLPTLSANATLSSNSTMPTLSSNVSSKATATLSANSTMATLSSNSSAKATSTLSANSTMATLSSNISASASATRSANSTMPTLSTNISANATSTLSANATMATLSANISSNATSTRSANSTMPTLSTNISSNATATLSANLTSATLASNLTGIPASGSGYSTIVAGNGSSSAFPSATALANATRSANGTSSVLPQATSVNSTLSSLASSASSVASSLASANASSASVAASSISSRASSASSAALSASSSMASAAAVATTSQLSASLASVSAAAAASAANISSAAVSSVSSASRASVSSVSAASVASASSVQASSAAVASASTASHSSSGSFSSLAGSTSSMVVVTRSSSASIASSTVASSTAPAGTAAAAQPTNVNIALYGKATASNWRLDSPPTAVNDGKTAGSLGLQGWMTAQNTLPQWIKLDFTNPYLMKSIYLYGPDYSTNTPYSGFLTFSDNSPAVSFGQVPTSGLAIDLGAGRTVTWVQVNIRTGYTWRSGTGLKEIKIFNAPMKTCGWWEGNCLLAL